MQCHSGITYRRKFVDCLYMRLVGWAVNELKRFTVVDTVFSILPLGGNDLHSIYSSDE